MAKLLVSDFLIGRQALVTLSPQKIDSSFGVSQSVSSTRPFVPVCSLQTSGCSVDDFAAL